MINIIDNNLKAFVSDKEIDIQKDKAKKAYSQLISRGYKGNDFLGWLYLPKENIDILDSIKDRAKSLAKISELVVVIGIGGSYLGARAVIEALGNSMSYLDYSVGNPLVIYAGHHIGEDYMTDLLSILDKKEYSLIVISKSGTT
ncbi:MAG: glucose-6-phosphate isomerase, partial [Bacteroidales bacterium]|nr:glucose-6-phosphate isomerase [Bacteroidales bacterium]